MTHSISVSMIWVRGNVIILFRISIKARVKPVIGTKRRNDGCRRWNDIFFLSPLPTIARMLSKVVLLVALAAICGAQDASYARRHTADMDFLHKQKKIFDLLLYVRQADLSDAEWYDVGRNYDMESNMDMYKDKVILLFIKDFDGIMEFRILYYCRILY